MHACMVLTQEDSLTPVGRSMSTQQTLWWLPSSGKHCAVSWQRDSASRQCRPTTHSDFHLTVNTLLVWYLYLYQISTRKHFARQTGTTIESSHTHQAVEVESSARLARGSRRKEPASQHQHDCNQPSSTQVHPSSTPTRVDDLMVLSSCHPRWVLTANFAGFF